jgi:hypothetical protein
MWLMHSLARCHHLGGDIVTPIEAGKQLTLTQLPLLAAFRQLHGGNIAKKFAPTVNGGKWRRDICREEEEIPDITLLSARLAITGRKDLKMRARSGFVCVQEAASSENHAR